MITAPTTQPLPDGTRVYHRNQEWARTIPDGTGQIVRSTGPYNDGTYEYLVCCGIDFSRRTGPTNPETREAWWPGWATTPAPAVSSGSGGQRAQDGGAQ